MFPAMVNPVMTEKPAGEVAGACGCAERVEGADARPCGCAEVVAEDSRENILDVIAKWSTEPGVLAWKMPGAGGGGYLACVVEDAATFAAAHPEAIRLTIRRAGM